MATANSNRKNWESVYDGFDTKLVGAGTLDPTIYSNPNYAKKKTSTLLIGGMNLISYGGWDTDPSPLIITIGYVPAYNVVLAWNLHYVPEAVRKAMVEFIIKANIRRIKKGQPMIVDYNTMKRVLPITAQIVRMYKLPLIKVIETVPLDGWGTAIQGGNKLASHHKKTSSKGNESTLKKFTRGVANFFK